jgi:hypothetical protein
LDSTPIYFCMPYEEYYRSLRIKTKPESVTYAQVLTFLSDKPDMMNRFVAWFRDRKTKVRQAIIAAKSGPGETCAPEWYAGLVVSPASFSRQLGDMQISLMRANEPGQAAERLGQTGTAISVGQHRIS